MNFISKTLLVVSVYKIYVWRRVSNSTINISNSNIFPYSRIENWENARGRIITDLYVLLRAGGGSTESYETEENILIWE